MTPRPMGMALATVLILLSGISILALAGLGGAAAAIALAGFEEQSALAFEAAEAGIARTLRSGMPVPEPVPAWPSVAPEVTVRTERRDDPAVEGGSWPAGFSVATGGVSFALRHGTVLSEGRAARGALVRIEQGFVVVAPNRAGDR